MNRFGKAGRLLAFTVGAVTGLGSLLEPEHPLSGVKIGESMETPEFQRLVDILVEIADSRYTYRDVMEPLSAPRLPALEGFLHRGVGAFLQYYSRPEQAEKVDAVLDLFESGVDPELLAEAISKVWVPELEMDDEDIVRRWRLRDLTAAENPIRPVEVLMQLNALYTVPGEGVSSRNRDLPERFRKQIVSLRRDPGMKVADYDHPVPLFEGDEKHELINCLNELESDAGFEKEQGILPSEHRIPVLLSVSVTHEGLDAPAGEWIEWLLDTKQYHHLQVIVLTESRVKRIKIELARLTGAGNQEDPFPVYTVFGTYGCHFNALKYSQILFEKVLGIRAGFKLDTDEGIRSRDLFAATGKTWFETLCHPFWGGTAVDWKGERTLLAVNEGEYINSTDIEKQGYRKAVRCPDVSIPNSWSGPGMFFQKGFAHGRATAIYNVFHSVEDGISHTVVKGGGYGITNEGLRTAVPFTFSWVGRAEDQQFYFSGIPAGVRGIFHPDLRIAHYKSSVRTAEEKTAATRFIGDMYRLIIFKRLAELAGVKDDIDPMPGVFAGELARAQAAFATAMKALEFHSRKNSAAVTYLLEDGVSSLVDLENRIERGEVDRELRRERKYWRSFIQAADSIDPDLIRAICGLDL